MNDIYLKIINKLDQNLKNFEILGLTDELIQIKIFIKENLKSLKNNFLIEFQYIYDKFLKRYLKEDLKFEFNEFLNSELIINLDNLDISLILKIENLNICRYVNVFLLCFFLSEVSQHQMCYTIILKVLNFINYPISTFEDYFLNQFNLNDCELIFYLRISLLKIFLNSIERLKLNLSIPFQILRVSCVNEEPQLTVILINFLLRQYVKNRSYNQAHIFIEKTRFDHSISVKQNIRHFYYLSKINAIRGKYYKSLLLVNKALDLYNLIKIRMSKLEINLLNLHILLNLFNNRFELSFKNCSFCYTMLGLSYRYGKLIYLNIIMSKFQEIFFRDGNYLLISRLRNLVLQNGLRLINQKYENKIIKPEIIIKKICGEDKENLLYTVEEFKYILMKNIKDEIINAKIIQIDSNNYELLFRHYQYNKINILELIDKNNENNMPISVSSKDCNYTTDNSIDI